MSRQQEPLRTCIVCGTKKPKPGLIRIAATKENAMLDLEGKTQGRGAYICTYGDCTGVDLHRKRLEYAVRAELSDPQWQKIVLSVKALSPINLSEESATARQGD